MVCFYLCICCTSSYFLNNFSIVIKIWFKFQFCSQPSCSEVITMKFCTKPISCIVVACANFSSNSIYYDGVTLKSIFHQFWITMEKSFMKWSPVWKVCCNSTCDKIAAFPCWKRDIFSNEILISLLYIFLTVTRVTIILTPHFKVSGYIDVFPPPSWILHGNLLQCDPRGNFKGPQVVTIY